MLGGYSGVRDTVFNNLFPMVKGLAPLELRKILENFLYLSMCLNQEAAIVSRNNLNFSLLFVMQHVPQACDK